MPPLVSGLHVLSEAVGGGVVVGGGGGAVDATVGGGGGAVVLGVWVVGVGGIVVGRTVVGGDPVVLAVVESEVVGGAEVDVVDVAAVWTAFLAGWPSAMAATTSRAISATTPLSTHRLT